MLPRNIQESSQRTRVGTPTMRQCVVRLSLSVRLLQASTITLALAHGLKLKTAPGKPKAPVELGHTGYKPIDKVTGREKCERLDP